MAPPSPPPPPIRFPITSKKPKRHLSSDSRAPLPVPPSNDQKIVRHPSFSPTTTYTTHADSPTFHSDSEKYDELPSELPVFQKAEKGHPNFGRSSTMTRTKKSTTSYKWGYGWGVGKKDKEKEREKEVVMNEKSTSQVDLPLYQPVLRRGSKSKQASRFTQGTQETHQAQASQNSKASGQSKETYRSSGSRSTAPKPRPPLTAGHALYPEDSTAILVGSAYDRKINDTESIRMKPDTTDRLNKVRRLMSKDNQDYYVVPSEDAHGSEYVAASDKRREFISGFTGLAGQAVITRNSAYLFTDSRYWIQAQEEIDHNWTLIKCGSPGAPTDWIEWLEARVQGSRIGIDARMISHEKATLINTKINKKDSKLVYPPQNLVDLIWVEKPTKSLEIVYIQNTVFAGRDATYKLDKLREWIRQQPHAIPSCSKQEATLSQMHVATLVTSLSCIAYLLNLRGSDIPYNPLFHGYLFVTLDKAFLFVEPQKLHEEVSGYLDSIGVQRKSYKDLWHFLQRREWGEGKVLIAPQTSYAVSAMLTHFRYTIAPSYVELMMSITNETEIDGMRRAYLREHGHHSDAALLTSIDLENVGVWGRTIVANLIAENTPMAARENLGLADSSDHTKWSSLLQFVVKHAPIIRSRSLGLKSFHRTQVEDHLDTLAIHAHAMLIGRHSFSRPDQGFSYLGLEVQNMIKICNVLGQLCNREDEEEMEGLSIADQLNDLIITIAKDVREYQSALHDYDVTIASYMNATAPDYESQISSWAIKFDTHRRRLQLSLAAYLSLGFFDNAIDEHSTLSFVITLGCNIFPELDPSRENDILPRSAEDHRVVKEMNDEAFRRGYMEGWDTLLCLWRKDKPTFSSDDDVFSSPATLRLPPRQTTLAPANAAISGIQPLPSYTTLLLSETSHTPSDISVCSVASSRTQETDYGLYYKRMALSLMSDCWTEDN